MPNGNHESRREAIRQLLSSGPAETQDALVDALQAQGYAATQSSVSRDLRELGALKTAAGYQLPETHLDGDAQMAEVASLIRGMHPAGANLLVINTAIGAAQRVALAFDRCGWPEIVGTIAGDDTIFVATETAAAQKNLNSRIEHAARS
ncbi:MAG: ArgR family transcriptional regulator [Pseudomonadota bacterium]